MPISISGEGVEDRARLCSVLPSNRTRGRKHKLMHGEFYMKMRKNFTVWLTQHWNRLSTEIVETLSLEVLKNCLDTILCPCSRMTLLKQRWWTR